MRDGVSMYTFGSTSKKERKFLLIKPKLMRIFPKSKKNYRKQMSRFEVENYIQP